MKSVEFYFDLGSPYSYLAYYRLLQIAEQQEIQIVYKPILLGGVFKATGNRSPIEIPVKGVYSILDMQRWAEYYQIPMQMNPHFPMNTLTLMRILTGVQLLHLEKFEQVLKLLFDAMFGTPQNLNEPTVLAEVLKPSGFSVEDIMSMVQSDVVKQKLITETEQAIQRGIFGAPTFFVGDEMYWGQDRLHFVEQALNKAS
ncbi:MULTISPECIES: 2-hydroxychromene-2-carboxylate isomerase [Acinetobacter]|jgi:2-hydroxychromene-2-carboxylate isomerase|uniref:2-hydroxychromene-2-carboxylate isomerase n=2 Tax=Acinetobacter TaxID=469 RepID=A0AAW6RS47_ACIJO|nr:MULTISPECIES: 2-hydroxychromene-2-carboxylate isomerase [Acinetobacter]AXF46258.1 2-hydroxychromene-2-carboxylate isomerase [Acinetobacter johnsonii]KUG38805.1 DSBA oxidoreductase [Acinetobacter johnsonii]MBL4860508.1 2-hydroxychromene-2-carboxylate isomerase [Acinetobacter sp.]MDG9786468.1 2-hydroxychromene-2-carboxylate isomerase [Acinetobacter johnsonii]MDG9799960.1 2-hydroxychromene-2-carboxylate isomerase [Acinetobacter johnsonii]